MADFFEKARPGKIVTHGCATFELPILYFRHDVFSLFFTADKKKVREALPSDSLHPLSLKRGRAIVGIVAFNYVDVSLNPYGELGVVVPVVFGKKPPPLIPLLREGSYPGFGLVVLHLPVTSLEARDAGRGEWNYPKFTTDMRFLIASEFMECRMSEDEEHILTIRVARRGIPLRDRRPFNTYTVKDGDLIKTVLPQTGLFLNSFRPKGCSLELGKHEVAEFLRELGLSSRPIQSRYGLQHYVILPAGEVVESGVRPMDGYRGRDQEGSVEVSYIPRE